MDENRKIENVVIIGSGPASYTAAIYAARANLNPLIFEGFNAGGVARGGQLTTTTEVENFPGFPKGIDGPELMEAMRSQAERFGTRLVEETVERVDFSKRPFLVASDDTTVYAKTVIVATGATAKRMNIPGEDRFWSRGMSACAVCDGGLPIYRNQHLLVVGGGDTACEEASHLTKFASKVTVIHRRDELRASKIMQKRLFDNPKVEILFSHQVLEAVGENHLTGIRIRDLKTGAERVLECGGLFYAIGHVPNTWFLSGQLEVDEAGYVKTKPGTTETNIPGVFAAGDVQDKVWRQAITAAGTGCMAALQAEHFLAAH